MSTTLISCHVDELCARHLRPWYIYVRRVTLERLERFLGGDLLSATTADLKRYLDRFERASSRAVELSHLRGFYRWAVLEEFLERDPTMRLVRPKVLRGLPRPIREDDLRVAVDGAPTRVRRILYLGAFAGLRACEIAPLRGDHLLFDVDPSLVLVEEGKGGKMGVVPVAPALRAELAGCEHEGWLFPRLDGKPGPTSAARITQTANRWLAERGIDATLHQARHRFGTQVYRASGKDLRLTQELMRHESPTSTAIYTWQDPDDGGQAVAKLPDLR